MSFSLFNSRHKKRVTLEEGEAPPKKIHTEGDALIKRLTEKQLETKVSLQGQLNNKKDFQHGEEFNTFLTNSNAGTNSLNDFQSYVNNANEKNKLKKCSNLSEQDINLYFEYKNCEKIEEFLKKYKNVDSSILEKRIKNIEATIQSNSKVEESNVRCESNTISRHTNGHLNFSKFESTETKLLRFAQENERLSRDQIKLPNPINEIVNLEIEFSENSNLLSGTNFNPKKIQKRARNLAKRISDLEESVLKIPEPKKLLNGKESLLNNGKSLWDVKEKLPDSKTESHNFKNIVTDKQKRVYTCPKQNLYTIKDGKILKLSPTKSDDGCFLDHQTKQKLTVEEIKNMPKFANYTLGEASEVLYIKNLPNNVTKDSLEKTLESFLGSKEVSVKVMSGKMKGQGFLEFKSIEDATEIIHLINGLFIDNKPMIVQFGRKKNEIKI